MSANNDMNTGPRSDKNRARVIARSESRPESRGDRRGNLSGGPPFMVGSKTELSLKARLIRFAAGLLMLVAFAGFFMSGYTPPGIAGEVLRHNQLMQIDASPLFYSEVEHMAELERAVAERRSGP